MFGSQVDFSKPSLGIRVGNTPSGEGEESITVLGVLDEDLLASNQVAMASTRLESATSEARAQREEEKTPSPGNPFSGSPPHRSCQATHVLPVPTNPNSQVMPGDSILAVNGAPLNSVGHHATLAERIAPLGRPLRITFMMSADRMERARKLAAKEEAAAAKERQRLRDAEAFAIANGEDLATAANAGRSVAFEEPPSPSLMRTSERVASSSSSSASSSASPSRRGSLASPGGRPVSRERPRSGGGKRPRLGWKALLVVGDLERLKSLKARLLYLYASEAPPSPVKSRGVGLRPKAAVTTPSLDAQPCLIEAAKICLKVSPTPPRAPLDHGIVGFQKIDGPPFPLSCCCSWSGVDSLGVGWTAIPHFGWQQCCWTGPCAAPT